MVANYKITDEALLHILYGEVKTLVINTLVTNVFLMVFI